MLGWIVFGVAVVVVVVAGVFLLRRFGRWNDPGWDTKEHQAEATLWSQRGDGGTL